MAGNTAYSGILVALDAALGKKARGRKRVEWYQIHLAKTDRKALEKYYEAYEILHLLLGYDGNTIAKVAAVGLELADDLITWQILKKSLFIRSRLQEQQLHCYS